MTDTDLTTAQINDVNFILSHFYNTDEVAQFFVENHGRDDAIAIAQYCVALFSDKDDDEMIAYWKKVGHLIESKPQKDI